jgi:hypothetical protein
VAQASFPWQQLVNQMQRLSLAQVKLKTLKQFQLHRFKGPGGWLLALTLFVAMLFWNWKLLLATSTGVFIMLLVYLMQEWDWQVRWSELRRLFGGSNRQLTLAVGSGGIASLSTYMAISIWVESDSPWIGAGAIIQGLGTLITIILLVWQIINRQLRQDEAKLNNLLTDLTDNDPLKRLIAVRQLTQQIKDNQLERDQRRQITDYFGLMLSREQESVVRNALLDGIQVLDNTQMSAKGGKPLQMPLTINRSTEKISRH